MGAAQSALLVEVGAVEPFVHSWRLAHDPVASRGIPAHITALFPFKPPALLDAPCQEMVARIVREIPAFSFQLTGLEEFPDALWLEPEPAAPFHALTRALADAFPDCPPYAGRHTTLIPHLTIAMATEGEQRAQLRAQFSPTLERILPLEARAADVALYVSDDAGRWRRAASFPFGGT